MSPVLDAGSYVIRTQQNPALCLRVGPLGVGLAICPIPTPPDFKWPLALQGPTTCTLRNEAAGNAYLQASGETAVMAAGVSSWTLEWADHASCWYIRVPNQDLLLHSSPSVGLAPENGGIAEQWIFELID